MLRLFFFAMLMRHADVATLSLRDIRHAAYFMLPLSLRKITVTVP